MLGSIILGTLALAALGAGSDDESSYSSSSSDILEIDAEMSELDKQKEEQKMEEKQKHLEVVEKLCDEYLEWANEWMEENETGSVYASSIRGLLEEMDANNECSYLCCDVDDHREYGFAVTENGIYFLGCDVDEYYSFDDIADAKIKYDDDEVYINDDCVNLDLAVIEAKKLYKLLKNISREFEIDVD